MIELAKRYAKRVLAFNLGRLVFDGPVEALDQDLEKTHLRRKPGGPVNLLIATVAGILIVVFTGLANTSVRRLARGRQCRPSHRLLRYVVQ